MVLPPSLDSWCRWWRESRLYEEWISITELPWFSFKNTLYLAKRLILLLLRSDQKELSSESSIPNCVQTIWRYLFRLSVDGAAAFCFSIKIILFFLLSKNYSCNFSSFKIFLVFSLSPDPFFTDDEIFIPCRQNSCIVNYRRNS